MGKYSISCPASSWHASQTATKGYFPDFPGTDWYLITPTNTSPLSAYETHIKSHFLETVSVELKPVFGGTTGFLAELKESLETTVMLTVHTEDSITNTANKEKEKRLNSSQPSTACGCWLPVQIKRKQRERWPRGPVFNSISKASNIVPFGTQFSHPTEWHFLLEVLVVSTIHAEDPRFSSLHTVQSCRK